MFYKIIVLFLLFNYSVNNYVINEDNSDDDLKCNYANCPKPDPNKLNVHLVAHTHNDVGWLKTVDQYYYGANQSIQNAGVQYILDSVIQSLEQNPSRRFIYVKTAFFYKWWTEQPDSIRHKVKKLVNSGQLELISGGWTMNDEACTHYNAIIDQMTWGFRRLKDLFGECGIPKIGWQIDPFGHSREQASLFAHFNFDGLFFSRLDYEDRLLRTKNKNLEMVWSGSDDLGKSSDIFTGAMYLGYGVVTSFCWDLIDCRDNADNDPIIDDTESEDYNVEKTVNNFVKYVQNYSLNYATNNIMYPMGEDFQYQNANTWFKNLDKLIKYVNQKQSKVNVFYSTPSCYLKSLKDSNHTFTTKSDDFFPYAVDPHSYWTGYFTSRPAVKKVDKFGNNFLQICKQLDVLSQSNGNNEKDINYLREWMGVMQHHDAVAGTEKQHVADNYVLKVAKSIEKCKTVINQSLNKLIAKSEQKVNQLFCQNLNISACSVTETDDSLAVTVYNPTAHSVKYSVRLPITNKAMEVVDPFGNPVKADVVPIPAAVLNLKERVSKAKDELVFEANLPALGFSTYLLKQNSVKSTTKTSTTKKISEKFFLRSKSFNVLFDKNGNINEIQLKTGKVVQINQNFLYYKSKTGNNSAPDLRASGAYIFRPDGQSPLPFNQTSIESKLVETSIATEIHQKINSYISQVIRVNTNEDYIEFDYVVGPIPVADKVGKEVISLFKTNLTTSGVFYTDANGRQLMKRVRDWRQTWNLTVTEPVSGNYYPINSRIAIKDNKQNLQLTVLNDRSQGGSSIKDGSVELMVHRRTLFDDRFGVNEPLNETGFDGKGLVIRGKFWLLISSIEESAELHRDLAQRIFMEPLITFNKYNGSETDYIKGHRTQFSGLIKELPKNVHLLTLEQWKDSHYLLRLEHFYQKNESQTLSKPVKVDLKNLFQDFEVIESVEQTLGANQEASRLKNRLSFQTTVQKERVFEDIIQSDDNNLTVNLNPMEIKTLLIKVKPNRI